LALAYAKAVSDENKLSSKLPRRQLLNKQQVSIKVNPPAQCQAAIAHYGRTRPFTTKTQSRSLTQNITNLRGLHRHLDADEDVNEVEDGEDDSADKVICQDGVILQNDANWSWRHVAFLACNAGVDDLDDEIA
jgi:hypothetical protein